MLEIFEVTPPAGSVMAPTGETIAFGGWLSLLSVLSDLIDAEFPGQEGGASGAP